MHVCFEILLPSESVLAECGLSEIYVSWGGEIYSQDPKKHVYKEIVYFRESSPPKHLLTCLPDGMNGLSWKSLVLEGDALVFWERVVNGKETSQAEGVPLKEFLKCFLSRFECWVVAFEINCDQIDSHYRMSSDELTDHIESILSWSNQPEGFVAFASSSARAAHEEFLG